MLDITATYTDQYELVMGQAYFLAGRKDQHAVFDYFHRKTPFLGPIGQIDRINMHAAGNVHRLRLWVHRRTGPAIRDSSSTRTCG